MNVESCCCGNVLRTGTRCRIIIHPCQCEKPGPAKRRPPMTMLPKQVTEEVYEQRKRLGLPIMTESERAAFTQGKR
jgi:hypothetical protein